MGWHNGKWLPLYVPQWYSPGVSQHPFDPYSFTHVLHGVLLFYVWYWIFVWTNLGSGIVGLIGFFAMFTFELIWELAENSKCAIERYRQTSGTSKDYEGDSYQNIIGDLIACQIGYCLSWLFNHFGMFWLSIILYLVTEICLLIYMRDCFTVTFVTLIIPIKKISKWQEEGVEKAREKDSALVK